MRARGAAAALAAATLLNLPFGTLYAFSIFLQPLEALLALGRAETSFVFGLATVTLTIGMNVAPRLYRALPAPVLAVACGACSAAGLLMAAAARGFAELAFGYGVLFGLGAGVGFIVVQQGVNQSVSANSGLANGYVVALYPLGAMLGAPVLGWAIEAYGLRATLSGLAGAVGAGCIAAAATLHFASIRMQRPLLTAGPSGETDRPLFFRLATVFFLAAAAGLMVMSQAAAIVQAYGGATALAVGATTLITGAVGAARVLGGWLADRFPVPRVAVSAHLLSLVGAAALSAWPLPLVTLPALAMIGMGYGIVSGLTAAAIAEYWERNAFGRIAARLYIAWCIAAISLPIIAGWLYDLTQGYGTAVLIAAGVNVLGACIASRLPQAKAGIVIGQRA